MLDLIQNIQNKQTKPTRLGTYKNPSKKTKVHQKHCAQHLSTASFVKFIHVPKSLISSIC